MGAKLRVSSLVPTGLVVESMTEAATEITVVARSCRAIMSGLRTGRRVQLRLRARRFACNTPFCPRKIFAERFEGEVVGERSRRSSRLECLVHQLGLALGGRPAASFARRLMLPVSNDTLLRVVRRRARLPTARLQVIGIDDWA